MSFFDSIVYSSSNEDSSSELRALNLNSSDSVLCITGSGARPLDLLTALPASILAVDLNPTQNFLLELKLLAFQKLNYDEMIEFLGIKSCKNRIEVFNSMKTELSDSARKFWEKHPKLIENGVLFCGKWEKFLRFLRKAAFFRSRLIHQLMNAENLPAQQKLWNEKWENSAWDMYLKIMLNSFLWKYVIREPGAHLIPSDFDAIAYMKNRFHHMGNHILFRESHYANLLFLGNYGRDCVLPHHLRKENFERIKENSHRISWKNARISDLSPTEHQFSAFSLSDFSSYASDQDYIETWKAVISLSEQKARFCERHFLVKRDPDSYFDRIRRNTNLEQRLENTDETAIYTFCAGTID